MKCLNEALPLSCVFNVLKFRSLQVSMVLDGFSVLNRTHKYPDVNCLLIKARHESKSKSFLGHRSMVDVVSSVAAYLIIAYQLIDLVENFNSLSDA